MLGFHTSSVAVGNQIRVILVNRKVVQANQAVCDAPDVGSCGGPPVRPRSVATNTILNQQGQNAIDQKTSSLALDMYTLQERGAIEPCRKSEVNYSYLN